MFTNKSNLNSFFSYWNKSKKIFKKSKLDWNIFIVQLN
jgi:hypothetical protein